MSDGMFILQMTRRSVFTPRVCLVMEVPEIVCLGVPRAFSDS